MALKHKEIKKNEEPKRKNYIDELEDYLNLKFEFRRNTLTLELEIRNLEEKNFKTLDEAHLNSIWINLQKDGFKCSDSLLIKLLNSEFTSTYDPLRTYFDNLPAYDGKDYIDELVNTIIIQDIKVDGIELRTLWKTYLKKWLVASAANCIGIGTNHTCLILVGDQGTGKTTWLNKLCPDDMKEFLVCSHIVPSLTDQNTANYLAEKWLVNIDDQLETIFGKDFNSMKAIITAPKVTNRKTWHRMTKHRRRISSFMGSVNSAKFLTDRQNRRYLVFTVEEVNYNHTIDMKMVWSQALHLAKNKFTYWFAKEEINELNKINDIYRQVSPEEEWLMKIFEPCESTNPDAKFLMPSEILAKLNFWSGMRLSPKRLSHAMESLEYGEPISKRIGGKSPRKVYAVLERDESDEQQYQQDYKRELLNQ